MQKLLLVFCLLCYQLCFSQRGLLFVKKHGHKVATFPEGAAVKFKLKDQSIVAGYISIVKSDSLNINGFWFPQSSIKEIVFAEKPNEHLAQQILLTTAFIAFTTTAITISKQMDFKSAVISSSALGFGRLFISLLPHFKRTKYRIGKKFTVQTLDLHF
jgi:hypothetical protein